MNSLCPGCEGSAVIFPARFLTLEVYRSWMVGRLALMIFSADLTVRWSLFSAHPSLSGLDRPPNWIGIDSSGQSGLQERSSVPTCPPSKTCTPPESGNWQGKKKSLQTPHTLDTTYSRFSPLVGATEHCSPKPPDTKTLSSPSPSHY